MNKGKLTKQKKTKDKELIELVLNGLSIDGGHHKQWYLERIADKLGIKIKEEYYEKGIAP